MKTKNKGNYSGENGITLIALVVTIVVLLILAGVSMNALFGNSGIIEKAKEAQNKMDKASENDQKEIEELSDFLDEKMGKSIKISKLVEKVVNRNTKAEDVYGNKITIPKGFKVLAHGTAAGSATYTYSGDNIPAVQDGIVIEHGTDGNQFVWVPVGTIKNKDNTTNTIMLGRYEFDSSTGVLKSNIPVQSATNYSNTTIETVRAGTASSYKIEEYYYELNNQFEGNKTNDSTAQNATARNLKEFMQTTLKNGGYYIARFEAGIDGTTSNRELEAKIVTDGTVKPQTKRGLGVWNGVNQPEAANIAREMYGDTKDYASDLVNSYAWDTAIIFIQTYSGISNYASKNKSTVFTTTGINNDKCCNIWDMSGNSQEWTTEYSTCSARL